MKSRICTVCVIAIFVVGMFAFTTAASAWEQGHVKIVPSCKYQQRWDSNIFYDPADADPMHDWMSITTPGILGEFGFGPEGKHKLRVDYSVELGAFYRFTDQNYGNHNLDTGAFLDFDDYTLDLNNNFKFTSSRAGTEFQSRNLRKEDTATAVLGWHYNKIDFDTGYQFYVVNYLSDTLETLNYYYNRGWITGYVQVAPKTQALLEFDYKNYQYPDTSGRNANAYAILTGVRGKITQKIDGTVKIGFKSKLYNGEDANNDKNFYGLTAGIDLFYDMSERVDMTLSYYREPYESTYGSNNYYTGDRLSYNVKYDLGNDFTAILDTFWFHNAYENPGPAESKKRVDDEILLAPRLEYAWKEYVVVGTGYDFHKRYSNIHSRGYTQHVLNADVKVMF